MSKLSFLSTIFWGLSVIVSAQIHHNLQYSPPGHGTLPGNGMVQWPEQNFQMGLQHHQYDSQQQHFSTYPGQPQQQAIVNLNHFPLQQSLSQSHTFSNYQYPALQNQVQDAQWPPQSAQYQNLPTHPTSSSTYLQQPSFYQGHTHLNYPGHHLQSQNNQDQWHVNAGVQHEQIAPANTQGQLYQHQLALSTNQILTSHVKHDSILQQSSQTAYPLPEGQFQSSDKNQLLVSPSETTPANFQHVDPNFQNNFHQVDSQYWPNPSQELEFSNRILPWRKPRTHLQKLQVEARFKKTEQKRRYAWTQAQRQMEYLQWRQQYRRHAAEWRRYQQMLERRPKQNPQYRHWGQQGQWDQMGHGTQRKITRQRPGNGRRQRMPSVPRPRLAATQRQKKQPQPKNYPTSIQAIIQQGSQPEPTRVSNNNPYPIQQYFPDSSPVQSALAKIPGQQLGQSYSTIDLNQLQSQSVLSGAPVSHIDDHRQRFPRTRKKPLGGHALQRDMLLQPSSFSLASAGIGTVLSSLWEIMETLIGSMSLFLYVLYSVVTVPLG